MKVTNVLKPYMNIIALLSDTFVLICGRFLSGESSYREIWPDLDLNAYFKKRWLTNKFVESFGACCSLEVTIISTNSPRFNVVTKLKTILGGNILMTITHLYWKTCLPTAPVLDNFDTITTSQTRRHETLCVIRPVPLLCFGAKV